MVSWVPFSPASCSTRGRPFPSGAFTAGLAQGEFLGAVRCWSCTVLYCTVLYCTVLYCIVQVLGKEQFPYQEAALRAVQLWHKLTPATVVLTIAHTGNSSNSNSGGIDPALQRYVDTMRGHGARVALHRVQPGPGQLSCVLSAQLVR